MSTLDLPSNSQVIGNVNHTSDHNKIVTALTTLNDEKLDISTVNAKGDMYVGTADNTVGRLAAGTNGFGLYADSSKTEGVVWKQPPLRFVYHAGGVWTNMPVAETPIFGTWYQMMKMDLSAYTKVRMSSVIHVIGSAGSKITLKYNAGSYSATAGAFSTIGETEVQIVFDTNTGALNSGWVDLVTGAKADVFLQVFSVNGNAAADPQISSVFLEFDA